LPDKESGIQKI